MVGQVYYSIDKEPEICAKHIAQAIKASSSPSNQRPTEEQVKEAGQKIAATLEKLIFQSFMKGLKL